MCGSVNIDQGVIKLSTAVIVDHVILAAVTL